MSRTVAVPVANGETSPHFGHCEAFAFFRVEDDGTVTTIEEKAPPAHAPGVYPAWLRESGADVVLAGGMGPRAQGLLESEGIEVVIGVPPGPPESVVRAWARGELRTGDNICSH